MAVVAEGVVLKQRMAGKSPTGTEDRIAVEYYIFKFKWPTLHLDILIGDLLWSKTCLLDTSLDYTN